MRRVFAAVAAATAGGRFISVWSILLALSLSLTVMASPHAAGPIGVRLLAGCATWACFAAALLAIGALERAVDLPRYRQVIVVVGVLVASGARPFVQDAWLAVVGGVPPPLVQLPFRIATNIVVWVVALTAVALIVAALRSVRETNALLRGVLAEIDAAQTRMASLDRDGRAAVSAAVTEIEGELRLLRPDAAAVRHLSLDTLRGASHTLAALADAPVPPVSAPYPAAHRHRGPVPLRLPPAGVVTALYISCLLPYAVRASSLSEIAISAVCAVGGGVCTDRFARRRWSSPRTAMTVFVGLSILVGLLLSGVVSVAGADRGAAVVPALVYPAFALGAAAIAGSLHTLRVEQRRLTGAVVAEQRAIRSGTTPTRTALRRAAEVLHREGQSQCTLFALQHPAPSALDIADLVASIEDVLTRTSSVFDDPISNTGASLDTLTATWGRVIDLSLEVSPDAATLLRSSPLAAQDVYEIVAEGILNAVKHTGEHRAEVSVDTISTGAGPRLRVRVRSFDASPGRAELRPGSHIRALGAHLRSTADGAVLEALIAPDEDAVVSAEHPVIAPISRS